MAGKKKRETTAKPAETKAPVEPVEQMETKPVEAKPDRPIGPIPGEVRIVNSRRMETSINLRDGRTFMLAPFSLDDEAHKSPWFAKKYLTDVIRSRVRKGNLGLEEPEV